jgi:hypothetical protein
MMNTITYLSKKIPVSVNFRRNGGNTAVLANCCFDQARVLFFLDTMTSLAVQIILDILFARHWRYFLLSFSLFILAFFFFGHNDFSCGLNNLRNPICPPLAVFSAETAVKPQFSNFSLIILEFCFLDLMTFHVV